MKLHFEPDLDYQLQAIEAVCDLFRGQETCRTEFTVTYGRAAGAGGDHLAGLETGLGIGNRLCLLDDELLRNLDDVQLRNGLEPAVTLASRDFTVEMETGTGKTYVYLRTVFELNRRFGFTKFVVVVPSVAIKEGVYRTLEITQDHFRSLYANVPFEYFLYDSTKLGQVRNFATSPHLQVMVVTVGAINKKDVNNLYKDQEKTGGERPIDLIRATRPVVIVDEPQSVDGGLSGAGRDALGKMDPLCTLRYSATHVDKHHMVYRLDAVDAYERRLVKQIEVASATVEAGHNKPYVRLVSVENRRGAITALVEVDVAEVLGVRRVVKTVQDGERLRDVTNRELYEDCRVGEIRVEKGNEYMELRVPGGEHFLRPGEAWGDVDATAVRREMIRRTIREHLDKEKRLRPLGIKVLSLFFIDAVDKYRRYDEDGRPVKGEYAVAFEEEYRRLARHPDYQTLFHEVDLARDAAEVHDGYFSIDRKGRWQDTDECNESGREAAQRAYNLIMKRKEDLLSFVTPLKFIFSHSALREGWDNPNVFQICSLRDIRTELARRQTLGRGLRLCVNQAGERQRGFEVNTLTVIASESYQQFADNLQKEIEADTGIRFGVVEPQQFAAIPVSCPGGARKALGWEASKALWDHLRAAGYIDGKGRVQDALRRALRDETLAVPEAYAPQRVGIREVLRKVAGRLEIRDAGERRPVRPREAVLHGSDFKALWDRIRDRTTYRVHFDNERLVGDCTTALRDAPPIPRTRLQWRKADIAIGPGGVEATERAGAAIVALDEPDVELPDLLTDLQDRTGLTRRTLFRILTWSGRLSDFARNPQRFIQVAAEAINTRKRLALVDGIKYQRVGDDAFYAQELFEKEELTGYLRNMIVDAKKSVFDHVVYDSGTEAAFADQMEKNDAVKVYAKLPGWFRVPTPLGTYNPDWAVVAETDGAERLFLVVETKGALLADALRETEKGKIDCGRAHFAALDGVRENPVRYTVATTLEDALAT
ncbi:MAG: DEAD/DEAH box helicase family protein [Deltaproteobacteria bacterium]|nr:DEAD/DEAH box helicase family protein [Deltaproteobacteria bacterium]